MLSIPRPIRVKSATAFYAAFCLCFGSSGRWPTTIDFGAPTGRRNRKVGSLHASTEAQVKRSNTQRENALAQHAWKPSDQPAWLTAKVYADKIQPILASMSASTIAGTFVFPLVGWPYSRGLPTAPEALGGIGYACWCSRNHSIREMSIRVADQLVTA